MFACSRRFLFPLSLFLFIASISFSGERLIQVNRLTHAGRQRSLLSSPFINSLSIFMNHLLFLFLLSSLDLKPCRTSQLLSTDNNHSHRHLTAFELEGLRTLCTLLRKFKDKSIPEDLVQPQQLLESMEVRVSRRRCLMKSPDPLASSY